jgi:hypothetical protein
MRLPTLASPLRASLRLWLTPPVLAGALAALCLAGCAAGGDKAVSPTPAVKELPPDPALLAKLPLLVDAVVYDDPALAGQAERLRSTLRRLAAAEGFTVVQARPKAPSILLQTSVQWSAATGLADQHLYLSLVLDQDGERVDEVSLQQTEGFPAQAAELDGLLTPLVRQLARSPRVRERIKSMP